jgi:hypothetical protein
MKKTFQLIFIYLLFFVFFGSLVITGCATTAPGEKPVSEPAVEEVPEEKPKDESKHEPEEPPEEEKEPDDELVSEEPKEEVEQEQQEDEFVVSEEVFAQTFSDVEALINELNKTIRNKNYDKWLTFLTEEYKDYYSSPGVLREISKKPTMQKYDIRLTTLKDYFTYVVVPSRSNARLDDLVFEDNNHVKAIMIIDEQRVILYQLVKVDGEWKIGV